MALKPEFLFFFSFYCFSPRSVSTSNRIVKAQFNAIKNAVLYDSSSILQSRSCLRQVGIRSRYDWLSGHLSLQLEGGLPRGDVHGMSICKRTVYSTAFHVVCLYYLRISRSSHFHADEKTSVSD